MIWSKSGKNRRLAGQASRGGRMRRENGEKGRKRRAKKQFENWECCVGMQPDDNALTKMVIRTAGAVKHTRGNGAARKTAQNGGWSKGKWNSRMDGRGKIFEVFAGASSARGLHQPKWGVDGGVRETISVGCHEVGWDSVRRSPQKGKTG